MKKKLLSICAFIAILFIGACGGDDGLPANVVEDKDGIFIELTWLTDGTSSQALVDADLDLLLYDGNEDLVDFSENQNEFELLALHGSKDDDEYLISVGLYHNNSDKAIDFIVTISGGGRNIEVEGSYSGSAEDFTLSEVLTITKDGNKYTVDEL